MLTTIEVERSNSAIGAMNVNAKKNLVKKVAMVASHISFGVFVFLNSSEM